METEDNKAVCESCMDKISKRAPAAPMQVYQAGLKTRDTKLPLQPVTAPATVGGKNTCPRCGKSAYPSEQVQGPVATVWHKNCLRCQVCRKQLDSNAKTTDEGVPYCVGCKEKI